MGSCLSSHSSRGSTSRLGLNRKKHGKGSQNDRKKNNKTNGASWSSSIRKEEHLHKIPGRFFINGSSNHASMFTQQGKKGTNQDAMLVWENFGMREDTVFCGIFDGHGPYGHLVSKRVRDSLPLKLNSYIELACGDDSRRNSLSTLGSMNSEETLAVCCDEEPNGSLDSNEREKHPEIFTLLKESFLKAFRVMDKELRFHSQINSFCSGSTAVALIKQGQDLIIGNVGDSRAILATRDEANNSLTAVQLTVDLKPNLPKEEERIKRCKGRVFSLQDEPDVARVWLPNNNSPGLAMARAFGDFCLKDFGLISVPEMSYRRITEKDEFIVLATDGVWDVLSNMDVVEVVSSAPSRASTARILVEFAVRAWSYKYPTSKVDDCAVVCFFLNADPSDSVASYSDARASDLSEHLENGNCREDSSGGLVSLERSATVRNSFEPILSEEEGNRTPRDMMESNLSTMVGSEWSALEGVSRVNTLLALPRFVDVEEHHKSDMNLQN